MIHMASDILSAVQMAEVAHRGQLRKYTGVPYITHPMAVAKAVSLTRVASTEAIIAAILHDVLEDTTTTHTSIMNAFGGNVLSTVVAVSAISKPYDGNRSFRVAKDCAHYAKGSAIAKTIKLADMLDNVPSIFQHDRPFAAVYIPEKLALLEVLREGDSILWDKAFSMLSGFLKELS